MKVWYISPCLPCSIKVISKINWGMSRSFAKKDPDIVEERILMVWQNILRQHFYEQPNHQIFITKSTLMTSSSLLWYIWLNFMKKGKKISKWKIYLLELRPRKIAIKVGSDRKEGIGIRYLQHLISIKNVYSCLP